MSNSATKDRNPIRAVSYTRFSSDNQREESIEAQQRAINEYADRNGYKIVSEYVDRARSATTDDRPGFQQMIGDALTGTFELVIVHKLDRFARNRYDSAIYKHKLHESGVNLVSVVENLDGSPESCITESVIEAFAEYYSKNLSREVMKGMKENALKCMHTGGIPPLGYDVDPDTKRYVVNESESLAVERIFKAVTNGKGYNTIIRELNELGYRTKVGGLFGKTSLHEILRNEKYRGIYVFNRSASKDISNRRNNHKSKSAEDIIRIEGGVPRIISDEDFFAVQKVLNSRKKKDRSLKAKENYLLSGKIRCGECGGSFCGNRKKSGRNKSLYVTYRCNSRSNRTSTACSNKEINKDDLETFVLKVLADKIFDETIIPRIIATYNESAKKRSPEARRMIDEINKKINKINIKMTNLMNTIAETGNSSLVKMLETLEAEMRGLESMREAESMKLEEVKVPEEALVKAFAVAKELFKEKKLDNLQQLINLYLEEVIVYKEHVELKINVLPFYHQSPSKLFVVTEAALKLKLSS